MSLFLKGLAMGAANVIPGVSGGTIALITGIYEKLIDSIKAFDLQALKLLFQFKFTELMERVNLPFLASVFAGVGISIFTLAKLLEFLLDQYEAWTMAFFFGLILISVYSVGRTVIQWNIGSIIALVIGTIVAVGIALLAPATENTAFYYVVICGIVAICSMILPGLSGSFVLIIMGNYALVLGAVGNFNTAILVPLGIGCVIGLVGFSQLLSWVFKRYRDPTISLMTGFILGSLAIIWPWKKQVFLTDQLGNVVTRSSGESVVKGYEWLLPDMVAPETWVAFALMLAGIISLWGIEKLAQNQDDKQVELENMA